MSSLVNFHPGHDDVAHVLARTGGRCHPGAHAEGAERHRVTERRCGGEVQQSQHPRQAVVAQHQHQHQRGNGQDQKGIGRPEVSCLRGGR